MDKMGFVRSVDNDNVIVEIVRSGACGDKCSSCKAGCETRAMLVTVKNNLNVSAGQLVKLNSDNKKMFKAVMLVYIMPLIAMIIGISLGTIGSEYFGFGAIKDIVAFGVGVIFLIFSFLILSYLDKKIKTTKKMELTISEIIC